MLLVHWAVSTAGTLQQLLGDISAFTEGNGATRLFSPISIQLLVSPALFQNTFSKLQLLKQDVWKQIVTAMF